MLILVHLLREHGKVAVMSYKDLAFKLVLMESASRDIVTRLTVLDDDRPGLWSFQTVSTATKREGLDPQRTAKLDKQVKAFPRALTR